jgi:multidrug efflux system outer membrane protein
MGSWLRLAGARTTRSCRRIFPVLWSVLLAPLLLGCAIDAKKPELNLGIPDSYRAARGDPNAALPAVGWWQAFRSPELTSLEERALASNYDIKIAIAQVIQANAQARISGAPLYPSIGIGSTAEAGRKPTSGEGSGASGALLSGGFTASYALDFWGKNRNALLAAEENAEASRYNREVVALSALASVADTYFQILEAQDLLRITRNNVAAASHLLDLVKQQFAVGTASQLDVSQQESLVDMQRASIPPLEITLQQSKAALAVLTGVIPESAAVKGGSLSQLTVPRVTPGLPSDLLARRPDVREAEFQLSASAYNVASARGAFYPAIDLTGTAGVQSVALKSLFGPGAWYYGMVASLTEPIFDGYLLKGQLQQAKGNQLQLLQTYRKAVISAFSDVEQALIAVEQTTQQERVESQVAKSSGVAFDITKKQLEAGTVNMLNTLETEESLFTAQEALAEVRFARLQAVVSLYEALGGGWPRP